MRSVGRLPDSRIAAQLRALILAALAVWALALPGGMALALPGALPGGVALAQNPAGLPMDIPSKPVAAFDFTAKDAGGQTWRLSELRGQVVLLNFWATWCIPCRAEMPAMQRLYEELAGTPFKMLAVNLQEPPARVLAFGRELKLTFPLLLDPAGEITRSYAISALPTTYIIDKQGMIVRRALGSRQWDKPAAIAFFRRMTE
ncbi:MAG: TlpA family protein disulfide reductase [Candidatus Lambdaproteobacteria bacterium]|nr:TlpA family protein disulfide reductase [Candidatus Lambdaproteobacteria bacterium]